MKKTAILLGATGLTGSILLKNLLADPDFVKVKLFSRTASAVKHDKIEEHIVDLFRLEDYKAFFKGDVVFCCIGTTKAKTPDKDTYKAIDYGIPVAAAKLAKENHIPVFMVISALNANPDSRIFYNKTKGEMQRDVLAQGVPQTYILQPSLITGNRNEKRFGEDLANTLMKVFDFLIPKKYKRIHAQTIAASLLKLSKKPYPNNLIPSDEIRKLGN